MVRRDCSQCLDREPMNTEHECHGMPEFGRYHLLMYLNKAFPIEWDMLAQVDSMAEFLQDYIHVALLQEGYGDDKIHGVNTICHIRDYLQSDFCLQDYINVSLLQEGYGDDKIDEVNTICNIRDYIQSDFCLYMVFNHLWINHPEPLKSINIPVHNGPEPGD